MLAWLRRVLSDLMTWPYGKNKSGPPVTIMRTAVDRHQVPETGEPCPFTEVTQTVTRVGRKWQVRLVAYCECGWREERYLPEKEPKK